jgi:rhodanese-related sulfurtransferase
MTTTTVSPVLRVPPAAPPDATAYFAARPACHTDVAEVHAALASGNPGFVLVDSRGPAAWAQGHIPGAVHLPTDRIPTSAAALLDPAIPVVTYCWGPGCDGATRAALALARLATRSRRCSAASSTGSAKASPLSATTAPGDAHPTL